MHDRGVSAPGPETGEFAAGKTDAAIVRLPPMPEWREALAEFLKSGL